MSDSITTCCANCRYSEMTNAEQGTCNRYAPKPAQDEAWARWPLILARDWCGEWAPMVSDDEMFADSLVRNAGSLPTFDGIPVLPIDEPAPAAPSFPTYDTPFEDPIR